LNRKITYPINNKTELVLETGCLIKLSGINTNPNNIITGISNVRIPEEISIGLIIETRPKTDKILNKFDPIILPIEIALSRRNAATTDVASSGNEVPNATIDMPITISSTLKI
tara:strand:+ start:257 stop:595 length:339 start_codon:yes stop_codon:yes gene_type:complete